MFKPNDPATTNKLLGLVFVVTGFTLVTMIIVELIGGTAQLKSLVENAGVWAPVVYVALKASTYIIAPLSGTSVELASGALFGIWAGALLSLTGSTLGAAVNYWIAHRWGRAGITKFAGKKALKQVDDTTEHVANWRVLLAARVVLSPIYDFISYTAGLTRIPFGQFVLVSFFGGIPVALTLPFLGHTGASNASGNYLVMAICGALFVASGAVLFYNKRQQGRQSRSD